MQPKHDLLLVMILKLSSCKNVAFVFIGLGVSLVLHVSPILFIRSIYENKNIPFHNYNGGSIPEYNNLEKLWMIIPKH